MNSVKSRYMQLTEEGRQTLLERIRACGKEFGIYPLSPEQRRMWFLYKTSSDKAEYNVTYSIKIEGSLDKALLCKALRALFDKQRVFKSRILDLSDETFQIVENDTEPELRELSESTEKRLAAIFTDEYQKIFDLENETPIRTTLITVEDGSYILLISVHHIFFDGWSANILKNDLLSCYNALASDEELPVVRYQYYDYALEAERSPERFDSDRKYWGELLEYANIYTQIPADKLKKPVSDSASVYHRLELKDKAAADEFCRGRHISPYSLYMAAYALTLSVFSGEKSVAAGTPVLNRNDSRWSNIIGFFSNTIPIFVDIPDSKEAFLAAVHERVVDGLDHGAYQLDEMASDLKLKREAGFNPLFQSTFALRNDMLLGHSASEKSDINMTTARAEHDSVMQFDLMGYVNDSENDYCIDFSARSARFSQERLDSIAEVYSVVLKQLLSDETNTVSDCTASIGNVSISSAVPLEVLDILSADSRITEPEIIIFGDYLFIYYQSVAPVDLEQLNAQLRNIALSKPFWIRLGEYPLVDGRTDREGLTRLALEILADVKCSIKKMRMSNEVISYDLTAEYSPVKKKFCHLTSMGVSAFGDNESDENPSEITEPSLLCGGDLPETSWRLVTDILKTAVEKRPDTEIICVKNGGAVTKTTYSGLYEKALNVAANLQNVGYKKGDRLILEISDIHDMLVMFWGIALAGMTALPLLPPQDYNFMEKSSARTRLKNVWNIAHCPDIVGGRDEYDSLTQLEYGMKIRSVDELTREYGHTFTPVEINEYDTVMMMFTSGSTGLPKGVEIHHHRIICRSLGYIDHYPNVMDNEILMNWMPMEHVGGLVMSHIQGVSTAAMQIEVESIEILKRPLFWLELIDRYRVTSTWAPNFAYGMLLDHKDEIREMDIDLSSVKHILNGGEAINYNSCDELLRLLAEKGLDYACMNPCWGMTETTSGILSSERFGEIKYNNSVAVGTLFAGNYVRIVDADNNPVHMGDIGRLQVKGESVFTGYYELDEENAVSFTKDGWFDTGDLAMIKEGEVIITGRNKEIIIVNGVNVSCLDIEKNIEEIQQIQTGTVGVSAIKDEETNQDQIVIFYGESDQSQRRIIQDQISRIMMSSYGFGFDYLVPIPVDEIPRSAIGKIEKKLLVKQFCQGELKAQATGTGDRIPMWFFDTVDEKSAIGEAAADDVGRIVRFSAADTPNGSAEELEQFCRLVAGHDSSSFIAAVPAESASTGVISGFCASVVQENTGIKLRTVLHSGDISDDVLLRELADTERCGVRNTIVRIDNGIRTVEKLRRIDVDGLLPVRSSFKKGGVYVLIGGFGGIGSLFTNRLTKSFGASVYIIGRKAPETVSAQLESLGMDADVSYISCDVSSPGQLKVVLNKIASQTKIDGIISFLSAGPEDFDAARKEDFIAVNKTAATIRSELKSVISAFGDIDEFLKDKNGIDFIAFTSVTGLFGGHAYSTYSAGSRFIYDFTLSSDGNNYFAFAWSKWKNLGLSSGDTDNDNISAEYAGYHLISGKQGVTSAEALLAMDIHRAIIGLNSDKPALHMVYPILFNVTAEDVKTTICYTVSGEEMMASVDGAELVNRESKLFLAIDAQLEERMMEIWKRVLLISELSPTDSFFEAGGNSLKLISLIDKINEEFGTELSVADLYNNPSVKMITALITQDSAGDSSDDENIIMI